MKKVLTYGTYDLLHRGHMNLLKRAKEMGDHLIVGLSSDQFNKLKKKQSFYSFEERKLVLEAIKYVDEVICEDSWDQKRDDIKSHGIELLVMGGDWTGKFDELKDCCEVTYIPRTEGISTSMVKANLTVTGESNLEVTE